MNKKYLKIIFSVAFAIFIIVAFSVISNPIASAKNKFSKIYSISIEIKNDNIDREYTFMSKDEISKLLDIPDTIEEADKKTETTADIEFTVFMNDNSAMQFSFEDVENYAEYFKPFANVYSDLTN